MPSSAAAAPGPGPFTGGARYNSYGGFLRRRFGCRVYKVIVDAGFTCPNRDGSVATGGCTYCSNDSFRPDSVDRLRPIPEQVAGGIEYLRARYRAEKFIVYFQPFSNTYAPLDRLARLYESALAHPDVVGLAVGTRPDCIDDAKLGWFERLARERFVTLEYGLESAEDATLRRVNRGHDFAAWLRAVEATRGRGIHVGTHLILGFPWESRDQMLGPAAWLSAPSVDFLKLHHLHVVRHTAMERQYRREAFPLLGYGDYVELVTDFLERLDPGIHVERLFGLAPDRELVAPRWGRTKAQMQFDIEQNLARRGTWQGRLRGGGAGAGPAATGRE